MDDVALEAKRGGGGACSAHPERAAAGACSVCGKAACERCLECEVDGAAACRSCGALADERSRSLGSTLLVLVGAAYLATLAIGYVAFNARPFVGGLAAIVAIVVGRSLHQTYLRPPVVTSRGPDVDASGRPR